MHWHCRYGDGAHLTTKHLTEHTPAFEEVSELGGFVYGDDAVFVAIDALVTSIQGVNRKTFRCHPGHVVERVGGVRIQSLQ